MLRTFIVAVLLASGLATAAPAQAGPDLNLPCDPLDQAQCLLPFPNDRFTTPDVTTDTGLRIDLQLAEMPRTVAGKPIDPTEWNRNDGFSPGSQVMAFVPGLDLQRTWGLPAPQLTDIGRSLAPESPILLVDVETGRRHPFWSELDTNAATADDERLLIVRPSVNLVEGHRYIVGLRNMLGASGETIPAGAHFAAYRDNRPGPLDPTFEESRRAEVSGTIGELQRAERLRGYDFDRSDLFLAWDFTVASERNLSERVLHIRDDAFAQLGDVDLADDVVDGVAPRFTITEVAPKGGNKLREVRGTITTPNYIGSPTMPPFEADPVAGLPGQTVPGGRFVYGPDGLPMQNPVLSTIESPFVCTIPATASPGDPAMPSLYGHGLLGSKNESTGGSTDRLRERNYMMCATDWIGFADEDIAGAVVTLAEPSNMPSMADRAQQGFLNFLFLGRALRHPDGLAADAAFRTDGGDALFTTDQLVYDGNSQGGIMGGALTALAVDHTRATLGVVGMNYSTLLNRSVDWEGPLVRTEAIEEQSTDPEDYLPSYSSVLYTQFPDKQQQQVVIGLLQMLWDRAEANGYAAHMSSDPLPNTPAHQVLLHAAYGDFQVANFSAEVEANTIGARYIPSNLMPGRHWSVTGQPFGLQAMPTVDGVAQHAGSALVYWDSGNLQPPLGNVPPLLDGGDPHEDPRRDPLSGQQRDTFYRTGVIVDVHAGDPYLLCRPGQEPNIPRVPAQFGFDWC